MKTSKKITLWSVMFVAIVAILLMAATSVRATPQDKVDICHATSSETNPWTANNVNKSSIIELPNGHQYHSEDIIPPFTYQEVVDFDFTHRYKYKIGWVTWWGDWHDGHCGFLPPWAVDCQQQVEPVMGDIQYPGKNMDTVFAGFTGAQILQNGCEIPYTACDETEPFVGEWSEWELINETVGPWTQVSGNNYKRVLTSAYARTRTVGEVDARDGQTVCSSEVEIERRGQIEFEFGTGKTKVQTGKTCTLAKARTKYYNPDGELYLVDPWTKYYWTNPLVLEEVTLLGKLILEPERCYEECAVTVPDDKVFGDWYELTDELWNDWVEDGQTRTRTGTQAFARDWTQNFYDQYDPEVICSVDSGTQRRGQLLKETEEKECLTGMYLLPGLRYPCYLNQSETDSPWSIPQRYVGEYGLTSYAQGLCNQIFTCDGWKTGVFQWTGEWEFVCTWKPCLDCNK